MVLTNSSSKNSSLMSVSMLCFFKMFLLENLPKSHNQVVGAS